MLLRIPRRTGLGPALLVLAALTGCAPATIVPPPKPAPLPSCLDQLTQRGIAFQLLRTPVAANGCGV
ncbi:MAG: hypothetical protein JOY66_02315, partial [Acetobacteraceae bacterium]|nr:hypothetical protein [Acetobacteraceae bacterium]